jgi:hypothetical protein
VPDGIQFWTTNFATWKGVLMATIRAAFLGLAATMGVAVPASASNDPMLQLIYDQARAGHLDQAQQMMIRVLTDHPRSAKAHYVAAELASTAGKLVVARSELNQAEQLDPGLPFASPGAVQALKAQLGLGLANEDKLTLAVLEPTVPGFSGVLLAWLGTIVWSIVRRQNAVGR